MNIETGEKLKWMYYDEYIAKEKGEEYIPPIHNRGVYNTRRVLCKTTGEEFNSIKEASQFYNISEGSISSCCNKKGNNSAGKDPETEEPLVWCYLD